MKRKMRKFDDGGKVYDKEDEGILGNKIKYREDSEGRKYTASPSNPMMRTPSEQRYYSMDDVKGKLSGLFGGKKEDEPKKSTTMPSGYEKLDATEGNARTRQISDYVKKSDEEPAKPAGKTYLNEEADIEEKEAPKKKVAPVVKKSKIEAAAPATKKASAEEEKKPAPSPAKAEDKKPVGKDATPMKEETAKIGSQGSFKFDSKPVARTRAGTIAKSSSDEPSALDVAAAKQKSAEKLKKQYKENEFKFSTAKSPNRSYKSGGSVRSASSRADGCAIRGKTRA